MTDHELHAIVEALENIAGAAKTASLGLRGAASKANTVFFLRKIIDLMEDKNRVDQFKDTLVKLERNLND